MFLHDVKNSLNNRCSLRMHNFSESCVLNLNVKKKYLKLQEVTENKQYSQL